MFVAADVQGRHGPRFDIDPLDLSEGCANAAEGSRTNDYKDLVEKMRTGFEQHSASRDLRILLVPAFAASGGAHPRALGGPDLQNRAQQTLAEDALCHQGRAV